MRSRVISRIIKAEVVLSDKTNRGLDNFRYHAKTEFNNYFITRIYTKKQDCFNLVK